MPERRTTVLIVEDDEANRHFLAEFLTSEGEFDVLEAGDAATAFQLFSSNPVDLVLLDVMLPDESGYNLCRRMKSVSKVFVPVILVTALNETRDKVEGLGAGADDFVSKPILREELVARTRSHLRTKRMMDRIEGYRKEASLFNERLQQEVELRTRQLQAALAQLRKALDDVEHTRLEIVERLGIAAEFRDEETGQHVKRMGFLVYEIASACGLPPDKVKMFALAAPLHDIGKMGVRDHVLLKPSQLEEGEEDLIRAHTIIGSKILANPRTELLDVACKMARSHHERWDGKGYPDGLAGDAIPLPARVCAVADAYDAMTSSRVYHPNPLDPSLAKEEIRKGAGTMFDPDVVEAFLRAFDRIVQGTPKGEL